MGRPVLLGKKLRKFVIDASVLLDFVNAEAQDTLELFIQTYGTIFIVRTTIGKDLKGLNAKSLTRFGIEVISPTFDELTEAGERGMRKRFHDWTNLIVARNHEMLLITNDIQMRSEARNEKVRTLWGFDLLRAMAEKGVLKKAKALKVAERMVVQNPFLTEELLARFRKRLQMGGKPENR